MKFYKKIIFLFCSSFPLFSLAQFSADVTKGCNPIIVQFTADAGPSSWNWTFNGGNPSTSNDQNPQVTYNNPGIFDVILNNDTLKDFIEVLQKPIVNFDTNTVYYASFTIICTDTSNFANLGYYIWKFENEQVIDTNKLSVFSHKYNSEVTDNIELVVVDLNGCSDSLAKTVNIKHQYVVPNVFTPNGDGVNDFFIVLANGFDVFPKAVIYNRWGNIVYETQNVSQIIWDGSSFDGSKVTSGTYFYVITKPTNSNYQYSDGELRGYIQVIHD